MFDDILVPTDGSDNAEAAVAHAVTIAAATDATVHGLYAINVSYATDFEGGIDSDAIHDAMEREGERATGYIESACDDADVDVTTTVVSGRPTREIQQYAADRDVDLIVMGTHGRSGVSRLLLGSVTESVLRKSTRPVLTISGDATDFEGSYDDLLIATDGSPHAEAATDVGLSFASTFQAAVTAVYVIEDIVSQERFLEEALQQDAERALNDVKERGEGADVTIGSAIRNGAPHEEIVEFGAETDVDMIVVGSHGKGAIERTVLGSVSERVVRTADRPVLVTKRPSE